MNTRVTLLTAAVLAICLAAYLLTVAARDAEFQLETATGHEHREEVVRSPKSALNGDPARVDHEYRISFEVTDQEARPLGSARVQVNQLDLMKETDTQGRAEFRITPGKRGWVSIRIDKPGYFRWTTNHNFDQAVTDRSYTAILRPQPQLRVLDQSGEPVSEYRLAGVQKGEDAQAGGANWLYRQRAVVEADGFLSLALADLPDSIARQFRSNRSIVTVFLLREESVPGIRLEIVCPEDVSGATVYARIDHRTASNSTPPLGHTLGSTSALPAAWTDYYRNRGAVVREIPGRVLLSDRNVATRGPLYLSFPARDGLRIYGSGEIAISCWIEDREGFHETRNVSSHGLDEIKWHPLLLNWPTASLVIRDRFGRKISGLQCAQVSPYLRDLAVIEGTNSVKLPPGENTYTFTLQSSVGSLYLQVPEADLEANIVAEFSAIEVFVRVIDRKSGRALTRVSVELSGCPGELDPGGEYFRFQAANPCPGNLVVKYLSGSGRTYVTESVDLTDAQPGERRDVVIKR